MNKTLLSLLIVVLFLGICIISCPKHEDHSIVITKEISNIIDSELANETESDIEKAVAIFATSICSSISEYIIDSKLSVDNYIVFSLGKITYNGEEKIVSFGILNHVYTDLGDKVKDELSKQNKK